MEGTVGAAGNLKKNQKEEASKHAVGNIIC
jgi:hypothetical protein